MNRLIIAAIVILACFGSVEAQRSRNPSQYLREFNNQKRKADIKTLLYLEASIKGEDPRRVQKYHEIVLEQMKESKKEVERIGPYGDDEILQREYVAGFEMLVTAFEKEFRKAEVLRDSMFNSFDMLKKYYTQVTEAEDMMYEAFYKITAAEDYFIKTNYLEFERDQKILERFDNLDIASLHARDMTIVFFRVEYSVERLIEHINAGVYDSIENDISDLNRAIDKSVEEFEDFSDFDGEDDLIEELQDYIADMKEEINFNLVPVAEKMQNRFLDEKEYNAAQRELQRFVDRHQGRVEDFYETRADFIEEYLPEE
jgi:hypothetical protein